MVNNDLLIQITKFPNHKITQCIEVKMKKEEVLNLFKESSALLDGHFKLTSGLHSNQYFQCALVLQHPQNAEKVCAIIADHFKNEEIDTVIAPAIGGIVVGQEVARQLNKKSIFAERKEGEMKIRRGFSLKPGEKVLVTEDVVTTGGSVVEVIELVKAQGAIPVGVGFIVDRSGGKADFGIPQFATFSMDVVTWQPEECPLCAKNVPIEKPGSRK